MIVKETKEGYVIESKYLRNGKILYVKDMICWPFTENPLEAIIFKTKTEALNAKRKIYKKFSQKKDHYRYKIRYIRISTYYEFLICY